MRRVVITGCGTINALGNNVSETWTSLQEGKSGINHLDIKDVNKLSSKVGAQVKIDDNSLEKILKKKRDNFDRVTLLALLACQEAVNCSGINFDETLGKSSGVILGTAGGGLITQDSSFQKVYSENKNRVHPLTVPKLMHNAATSQISIDYDVFGPSFTISTACASSSHAIGQAFQMIRNGNVLAVLAGGSESMLCYGGLKAWEGLRITAKEKCRPFCATRDGMIQGEGATVFVLEELEHALKRKAEIHAEIIGFSMTADSSNFLNPSVDGLIRAMSLALIDAKLSPIDINYINTHGTGTAVNDRAESLAILKLFGNERNTYLASSTKSMHGHLIGASGAIELLSCILALKKGVLAPTINFEKYDGQCNINLVTNDAQNLHVSQTISNSFAFGGLNAVLVLKKFH